MGRRVCWFGGRNGGLVDEVGRRGVAALRYQDRPGGSHCLRASCMKVLNKFAHSRLATSPTWVFSATSRCKNLRSYVIDGVAQFHAWVLTFETVMPRLQKKGTILSDQSLFTTSCSGSLVFQPEDIHVCCHNKV